MPSGAPTPAPARGAAEGGGSAAEGGAAEAEEVEAAGDSDAPQWLLQAEADPGLLLRRG